MADVLCGKMFSALGEVPQKQRLRKTVLRESSLVKLILSNGKPAALGKKEARAWVQKELASAEPTGLWNWVVRAYPVSWQKGKLC